jgi:hypothetical protein
VRDDGDDVEEEAYEPSSDEPGTVEKKNQKNKSKTTGGQKREIKKNAKAGSFTKKIKV